MRALARAAALFVASAPTCWSQQKPAVVQRFEVGGQFANIGFSPCNDTAGCPQGPPHAALGPGLTVNLNQHFAIDSTLNYIVPRDATYARFDDGSVAGGRGLEFLIGPRAEVRAGRLGVFVDARTGFLNWSRVAKAYVFNSSTQDSGIRYGGDYFLVVGANAGVEYAVTPRTHFRIEAGDQYINYGHAQYLEGVTSSQQYPSAFEANAMLTTGVYIGVGRPVMPRLRAYESPAPHRFFDRTNLTLVGISVLAQVPDIIGTQRFIHRGEVEQNALARPFVDQGWAGAVGLAVITNVAQVAVMYGLHKMGHHRLERTLPVLVAVGTAYGSYANFRNDQ